MKFYDIPKKIRDLEFDGDIKDKRLHYTDTLCFYTKDKKEYEAIETAIQKTEIKKEDYTVYAWCDVSGYDYWIVKQEEANYIQVSVAFEKEEVPNTILEQLEKDIEQVYYTLNGVNF